MEVMIQRLLKTALPIIAALLYIVSFPAINWYPVAWIALIPLFYAIEGGSAKRSFLYGMLFSVVVSIGLVYWVSHALLSYSSANFFMVIVLLVFVLGCGFGTIYGFFSIAASRIMQWECPVAVKAVLIACAWVITEYIRAKYFLFSGAPWALLGHSQYKWLHLIQIVDITGVYGLSFLIILTNFILYSVLKNKSDLIYCARLVSMPIILLVLVLTYGSGRLSDYSKAEEKTGARQKKVAIIQVSIPQDAKWRRSKMKIKTLIDQHLKLTKKALDEGGKVIIWPETTMPIYLEDELPLKLKSLLSYYNAELITGGPRLVKTNDNTEEYNSVFMINRKGIVKHHDKIHLLPFGEYYPLGFMDILKLGDKMAGNFTAGNNFTIFETKTGKLGALVCFEVLFPHLSRGFIEGGAEFLVNISNDAWFGKHSEHSQHFSMAVFTAVSFRRQILRSANTGISGVIDASGRIKETIGQFEEGYIISKPLKNREITFYSKYGDFFAGLCFFCFFIGMIVKNRIKITLMLRTQKLHLNWTKKEISG